MSTSALVAPVPARAAPLQQPSFMPSSSRQSYPFPNAYAMDDDLAPSHTSTYPIRPPSPIPGSASDHFAPSQSVASTSSFHHSTLAHARSIPYPKRTTRLSHPEAVHRRHRAPSTSYTTTSCPTPSSPRISSIRYPSTALSSPGPSVSSPAYPAEFYPTPIPSPPRRAALTSSVRLADVYTAETPDTADMDRENDEDYPRSGGLSSDERAHIPSTSYALPSFHDLLQSLHPDINTNANANGAVVDSEKGKDTIGRDSERRAARSSSPPMSLMFTPVSNATMACAMEGLDVERLAGEVNSLMDLRSW